MPVRTFVRSPFRMLGKCHASHSNLAGPLHRRHGMRRMSFIAAFGMAKCRMDEPALLLAFDIWLLCVYIYNKLFDLASLLLVCNINGYVVEPGTQGLSHSTTVQCLRWHISGLLMRLFYLPVSFWPRTREQRLPNVNVNVVNLLNVRVYMLLTSGPVVAERSRISPPLANSTVNRASDISQ